MYSSHNRVKYSCLNKKLVEVHHITTSLYDVVKSCPFYTVVAARVFIITSGLFFRGYSPKVSRALTADGALNNFTSTQARGGARLIYVS